MLDDEAILINAHEIFQISQIHPANPFRTDHRESRRVAKLTMVNNYLQMLLLAGIETFRPRIEARESQLFQSLGVVAIIGLLASASACGTPRNEVVQDEAASQGTAMSSSNDMPAPPGGEPINKRFASLDDYLAWLRQTQAPVDGPWYEEIRPGVYQLHTGNLRVLGPEGDQTPRGQTFSREQLMKKFGFSR